MPDMERITDQIRVDMAAIGYKAKGKNAEYWDGYRKGKRLARLEVAIVFAVIYFGIAAIGNYYT